MPYIGKHSPLADSDWLRERYIDQRAGMLAIAAEVGCSEGAVRQALARHEIQVRRGRRQRILADLTAEQALALIREHGLRRAARELGVVEATFNSALGQLGIFEEARQVAAARERWPQILRDKEALKAAYRRYSLDEIGRMHGCARGTVVVALRKHGIPVRAQGAPPPDRPLTNNPNLIAGPGERQCLNPPCLHRPKQRGLCRRCWHRYEQGYLPGVTLLAPYDMRRGKDRPRCDHPGCAKLARRRGRCQDHPLPPGTPFTGRAADAMRAYNDARADAMRAYNQVRRDAAAAATVEAAQRALADYYCPPEHHAVLRARVEHPTASLADLAGILGVSKDAYAGRLRRALTDARETISA